MHGTNNMKVQLNDSEIVRSVHCSGGAASYMFVSVCIHVRSSCCVLYGTFCATITAFFDPAVFSHKIFLL